MEANYNPKNYFVHIDFEPKWAFIGSIRGFTENFIFTCIKNQFLGKAVALSVSELLENAVKYSITNKISLDISFQLDAAGKRTFVVVKVYNFTDENNIKELKALLDEIHQDKPEKAYLKCMQKIMEQDKHDITSRLGLSRIRYECSATLEMKVEDNNYITMMALMEAKNE